MTTFQMILYSLIQAIGTLLPVSVQAPQDFFKAFLDWSQPSGELEYWVTLLAILVLLVFFRFDWLGMISAFLKTIVRPKSLNASEKTLDQQIVLFLLIASLPGILLKAAVDHRWIGLSETVLTHPGVMIGGALISFLFLQLGLRLNKRLRGLNHLRLIDGVAVGGMLLLSAHPAFSVVLLSFSAFAMVHYHSEAIFKYTFLLLMLFLIGHAISLGSDLNLHDSLAHIGWMNGIVVTVLSVTVMWITLENFQKNFTMGSFENSFRFFRWVQILVAIVYGVILFLHRGAL